LTGRATERWSHRRFLRIQFHACSAWRNTVISAMSVPIKSIPLWSRLWHHRIVLLLPRLRVLLGFVLFSGLATVWAQVRLSPVEADKLIAEKTEPGYPTLAKQLKFQGTVTLDVSVSETGNVSSTKVIKGHPFVIAAAVEAVRKWKYQPFIVNGKATPFITTVDIAFSAGIPQDVHERQQKLAAQYFKQDDKCRELSKRETWKEAEKVCKAAVALAEGLDDGRQLEKMGAYNNVGFVLFYQNRFSEALEYFSRAFDFARSRLGENDADLGYAYRNLAIANHSLKNLDKARELYGKAEKTLQLAHATIGNDDLKQRYLRGLKEVLKSHLLAAEQAGAQAEVDEIKKRLESLH
jgi:TonB family protein